MMSTLNSHAMLNKDLYHTQIQDKKQHQLLRLFRKNKEKIKQDNNATKANITSTINQYHTEEKKDLIVGNTLITKQITLTKNPEQVQAPATDKQIEKKRTLMLTLNKDVSQIRLNQVKSHAEFYPLKADQKLSPKEIYNASPDEYDENEADEEVQLHNLLKKMLNRSIDLKNQLQIYQELTKLEE